MSAEKGNKYAVGNEGGRPPIHTDPIQLSKLVKDYFEYIEGEFEEKEEIEIDDNGKEKKIKFKEWIRKPEPPTVTGLTLHLGFAHKSSLYDYAEKEEFSDSIKSGLTRIEKFHETRVSYGDKCTGNIFILKNFGWKDKMEVDNRNVNYNSEPISKEELKQVEGELEDDF